MNVHFVDSHVHLSDYEDAGILLVSATSTDTRMLCCSVDEQSSHRTIALARAHPGSVSAFVGVHPSEASDQMSLEWLGGFVGEASGIGEIGLDPKYSYSGKLSPQALLFARQLAIAETAGKPVQVHSRNAEAACLELLGTFSLRSVLLHWFNSESELTRAEQKGYFISFGPALLQSKKLQKMAASYSPDLVLAESDGPVTFSSFGGAGGPLVIPSVLFRLAELNGTTFEEMAERAERNAARYLPAVGKVKPPTDSGLDRKIGQD